jgi:hypothetical protein
MGKLLENNVPVFIISFNTQEVLLFRNAKTGEIAVGAEDKVEQCSYVAAITRVEEELDNELTGGWKVIDASVTLSSHRSQFLTRCVSVFHRWQEDPREHIYRTQLIFAFLAGLSSHHSLQCIL